MNALRAWVGALKTAVAKIRGAAGSAPMPDFADEVRIRVTQETRRLGLAGRQGQVFGFTTPSVTGVAVVGSPAEDFAINVHFDDLGTAWWFSNELVEVIGPGTGTVMSLDGQDTQLVRLSDGDWLKRPRST
jgi:hypothetical protein